MVVRCWLLLAEQTVWQQLPEIDRARLTMAMLAFVALLVGVIAFVLLMSRFAKREIRRPLPPMRSTRSDALHKPTTPESAPSPNDTP